MQIQFRNFEIELKVRKLFWKNGFKKYKLRTNIGKAKNKIIGKIEIEDYSTTLFKFVIYSERFVSSPR